MLQSFYLITFWVTLALGSAEKAFNVTSGVEDYFKASQLQLMYSIKMVDIKIANVDANFAARLDVIHYEYHQMLHEIHQVDQNLIPLQFLSIVRKHCIQKYAPQFVTPSHARRELKICHDRAKLRIESLTSKAKASVLSAKNFLTIEFVENVRTCNNSQNIANNSTLERCYIENVELATKTVDNYLRNAQEHLEKSVFESSFISRNAARCSYHVTSEILKSLGGSLKDIANCQKDFTEEIPPNVNQIKDENVKVDKVDINENLIKTENEQQNENYNANEHYDENENESDSENKIYAEY